MIHSYGLSLVTMPNVNNILTSVQCLAVNKCMSIDNTDSSSLQSKLINLLLTSHEIHNQRQYLISY